MQTFTDTTGHKWTVAVNIGTVKRVRARLGIDMLDPDVFITLMKDLITICDVIYVLCQDDIDKQGLTEEQFMARLGGPVLLEARDALTAAYSVFLPDPESAARFRVVMDKNKILLEKTLALVEKKMPQMMEHLDNEIAAMLAETEKVIDQKTASITGQSLMKPPESSESTRRRSRSMK